jgi:tetratricopeptide (TPR) repeat protein
MGEEALKILASLDEDDTEVKRIKAEAHMVIGLNVWRLGNIDEAAKHLEISLGILTEIDDKKGMADVYNHLGIMNSLVGHQEKALQFYAKSLSVLDKARCYINIGIIKAIQGHLDEAEESFKTALKKAREEDYKLALLLSQMNLAELYLTKKNAIKARAWANRSLQVYTDMHKDPRGAWLLEAMARISLLENDLKTARADAEKAMEIAIRFKARDSEARIYHAYGLIAMEEGNLEKAKMYLEQAIEIMKEINLVRYIGSCYVDLAIVNRKLELDSEASNAAKEARKILENQGAGLHLDRLKEAGF